MRAICHQGQSPAKVETERADCIRQRSIAAKFHYETDRQASLWLNAHNRLARSKEMIRPYDEAAKALTDGVGPDIVIETAGVPIVFKESLDYVRRGGIVVEVGHFTDPGGVDIHPNVVCFKDLDIRGMWAYPAIQFKTALSFLKNTTAPLDDFITHRVSLAQTEEGIDVTGSEGSMKVVVEP